MQSKDILSELFFITHKFKTMRHILDESNPQSFNIITYYSIEPVQSRFECIKSFSDDDEDDGDCGEWFVSTGLCCYFIII